MSQPPFSHPKQRANCSSGYDRSRRAVDRLPEPLREIVRLFHLEGLSLAQIADRLDVPIGTVKSRSHRAHRRLFDSLAYLYVESEEGAA